MELKKLIKHGDHQGLEMKKRGWAEDENDLMGEVAIELCNDMSGESRKFLN
jgi:hypothetical protein